MYLSLSPPEGVFIWLPVAARLTSVGEVMQGRLTVPIPTGYSILASKVPQAGTLSFLSFPAIDGDVCFKWLRDRQMFDPEAPMFIEGIGWYPVEPTLQVGESTFLFRSGPAGVWVREFNLNG